MNRLRATPIPNGFKLRANRLCIDDKLLLAFDAFVLSEMVGREIRLGKIIHGDSHATVKVKTSSLAADVRKRIEKIAALLSSALPPDLVLNRHCAECEFHPLPTEGDRERRSQSASWDEREGSQTHQRILERVVSGNMVHADETHASVKGKRAYVWVFTNMHDVAYLYCESREGELVKTLLGKYKGVLISDFYAVYNSFDCPQQKCLIHLVRDLNGVMLDNPYDTELQHIVRNCGQILKTIVEDIDRYGLKKHFLHKHVVAVDRFYRKVVRGEYQSQAAVACQERFEKNRDELFTFLRFDGVPWNNNNAEHAIKAFARLRDTIEGSSTEKGIREYLILLSVCQTCKNMGVDFLDFVRSGEKDIHAFAESERARKRRAQVSRPAGLPSNAIPNSSSQP